MDSRGIWIMGYLEQSIVNFGEQKRNHESAVEGIQVRINVLKEIIERIKEFDDIKQNAQK